MRLEVNLVFDTTASSLIKGTGGKHMADSDEFRDFSANLARQLKAKRENDNQKNQKAIQDMGVLKRGFDALWKGVHESLTAVLNSVNNNPEIGVRLVSAPNTAGVVIARPDTKESLHVKADPEARTITFRVANGNRYEKTYTPRIAESQTEYYFVDERGSATTISEMCMRSIAEYLGVPLMVG
jgi:hypothetical protein